MGCTNMEMDWSWSCQRHFAKYHIARRIVVPSLDNVKFCKLPLEPPPTAFLWLCKYHLPFGSSETRLTFTFAICLQLILPGAMVENGEEWN